MPNHLYLLKKRNALLSAIQPHVSWLWKYRFSIVTCFIVSYLLVTKDLSLQLTLSSIPESIVTELPPQIRSEEEQRVKVNQTSNAAPIGNTYSNLGNATSKKKKQIAYVKRFSKIAQTEMQKFGIPASIKLAQGLLESNAGESPLSRKNNNHFGMKCFSTKCKKGHCSNFSDDSHKDFFRVYQNSWESYRAHSKMLHNKRYKHLFKLRQNDYKSWARGLKASGYATDKRYAEKIIRLIEDLKLYRYDQNV